MREIIFGELRRQEFLEQAARVRLAQEAGDSDRNGLDRVEAVRSSLQTVLDHTHDILKTIEWTLFSMRRNAWPH